MVASPISSVQPVTPSARPPKDAGWLRKRLSLNFFLGLFSLGTCALLWQFARPLGIPLLSNLPPITEVITASKQLLLSNLYWEGWMLSVRRITMGFCWRK